MPRMWTDPSPAISMAQEIHRHQRQFLKPSTVMSPKIKIKTLDAITYLQERDTYVVDHS